MKEQLSGKTAIVTGGCRGIGKAVVERLASEGCRVFALDYIIPSDEGNFIDNEALQKLVKAVQCDVTSEESVTAAIDFVLKSEGRIDILVNNAGITRDNLLMRLSEKDWDSVLSTNLKGAFLVTKAVIKTMMSQRSGRIINISSVVGISGNAGQVNYAASKAGLIGLTKSLAKELGSRNILVNCIAPGFVRTPMTERLTEEQKQAFLVDIPLKRAAEPEDIANAAAFFAGNDSSYITGQVLPVCGGLQI